MSDLRRIDPSGCGCTDCLTGYSKPIDACDKGELLLLVTGVLDNASGHEPEVCINGEVVASLKGPNAIRRYFIESQ